jgi:hypothetical protein
MHRQLKQVQQIQLQMQEPPRQLQHLPPLERLQCLVMILLLFVAVLCIAQTSMSSSCEYQAPATELF